jgi:F-type H+-transporting ATPase subunit delta
MPLSTSQPDAASRMYAHSLFDLASKQGGQGKVEECAQELEDILEIARTNSQFAELLSSPSVAEADRAAAINKIFSGRVSPLTLNFMQVLNTRGRLIQLSQVADAYTDVIQEKYGKIEVEIITAKPLSADELTSVRNKLSLKLGKDVIAFNTTDATMIGGIRFRIGDQLIDGSVSSQLRRMQDKLANDGIANLRSRMNNIIGD